MLFRQASITGHQESCTKSQLANWASLPVTIKPFPLAQSLSTTMMEGQESAQTFQPLWQDDVNRSFGVIRSGWKTRFGHCRLKALGLIPKEERGCQDGNRRPQGGEKSLYRRLHRRSGSIESNGDMFSYLTPIDQARSEYAAAGQLTCAMLLAHFHFPGRGPEQSSAYIS